MDRRSATIVPTTKGTISSSSSFSVARRRKKGRESLDDFSRGRIGEMKEGGGSCRWRRSVVRRRFYIPRGFIVGKNVFAGVEAAS